MTLAVHSLLSTSEKKKKQFMILPSCRSVFSHQCKVQWGKPQRPLWLYSCLASETLAEGVREHFQTQFYWSFQFRGFLWVLVKIFCCYLSFLSLLVFVVVSVFQWKIKESQLGFSSKYTFEHIMFTEQNRNLWQTRTRWDSQCQQ